MCRVWPWHTLAETVVAEMGWLPTAPSEFLLSRPVSGAFSALWDKPLRLTADPPWPVAHPQRRTDTSVFFLFELLRSSRFSAVA